MNDINQTTCNDCGSEIPSDAPAGICPHCLLKQSIDISPLSNNQVELPSLEELSDFFPKLDITSLIGRGGMGAVYKARQTELDRDVAVKIIPLSLKEDPELKERFLREAKALAQLNHSNIVSVHNFGEKDGHYFLVMEYVEGSDLQHKIDLGELTPAQTLSIICDLCEAIEYAHNKGIVHRDIKPSNILIGDDNKVKIADFGLAKIMQPDPTAIDLTLTDQTMGTLYYMAPEQRTDPQNVDQRADIYAIGVLIYEMLTGELPIGSFDPPSKKINCSPTLDDIVLKALSPDPDKRYQSILEIKHDIEQMPIHTPKPASSGKGVMTAVIVFAASLLLAISLLKHQSHQTSIPSDATEFGGNFYALHLENLSWDDAAKKCAKTGGHLAIVTTREEADFVAGLSRSHAWIGATDEINEGEWLWTDGSKMDFSLWEKGEPNNAEHIENYLMISKYGFWNDFPAWSDRIEGYVCEWEGSKILTPITSREDMHKRLRAFNPDYKNNGTFRFEEGNILEIGLVRAEIETIRPLKGCQLQTLNLSLTKVSDLSPLQGMKLRHLDISRSKVTDLSPLKGIPLEQLHMNCLDIKDISALEGMPLKKLGMLDTSAVSVSPLTNCVTLESIDLPETIKDLHLLKKLPNLKTINNKNPSEF